MSEEDKVNLVIGSENSIEGDDDSEPSKSDDEGSEIGSEEEIIESGPEDEDIEEQEDDVIENNDEPSTEVDKVNQILTNIKNSETQAAELPTSSQVDEVNYPSDSDEEYDEDYLQKFDDELKRDYLVECHPQELSDNYDQISAMSKITRNKDGIVSDALHRLMPELKYL
jgi:hypothetical protein